MTYTVGHRLGHCTGWCLLQPTVAGDPQRLVRGSSVPKQPGPQGPASSLLAQAGPQQQPGLCHLPSAKEVWPPARGQTVSSPTRP